MRKRRSCSSRARSSQYSNAGINTAGRIIEVAQRHDATRTFLDERLFGRSA